MKGKTYFVKLISCGIIFILIFSGCAGRQNAEDKEILEQEEAETGENKKTEETEKAEEEKKKERKDFLEDSSEEKMTESEITEPKIIETDWSGYFDGLSGAAVLYDASAMEFTVYNSPLAQTRRSPCSTFKIVSSLIALENGMIDPDNSTRRWSGEIFWKEDWNQDLDFPEAFQASCVWYFREVIDEIGQEKMQEELDKIPYGNCDISDWEGRLNTNNSNRALTGFWIESSLKISPKEQTEVMERIFGKDSVYSEQTRNALKEVMLVEEQRESDLTIYGKTGMGKAEGILVDAWFTGFAEQGGKNVYFCVYLGQTDEKEVSSAVAKEIAIRLVTDDCSRK